MEISEFPKNDADLPELFNRSKNARIKNLGSKKEIFLHGSVEAGTLIIYGNNRRVNFSAKDFSKLLQHFKGRIVAIGTSHTEPPKDSVGEWIKDNTSKPAIASYLGPILIKEGYAEKVGRSEIRFF